MRPALALLALLAAAAAPARRDEGPVDFAREIEPLLRARCHACHGPTKQKAGLRLDRRADALAGAWGGEEPVILPGRGDESALVLRVRGAGDDERMPPEGPPLEPREIEALRRWIDEGARWPESGDAVAGGSTHWAYVPPRRPEPPAVRDEAWCRNAIDRFVLARLEAEGLAPSPEAPPATLLRRAALALTGLPPEPVALETFLADGAPDAFERAVDALLASTAYAEHQARLWLDLARYADTNGYETDQTRANWRWRDWVIEAFEQDMPFDRFTRLQFGGDLIEGDPAAAVATGFHRNTMTNMEGGADPEEFRVAAVVDRINTVGSVWLGTTLACAQCHDHKYDPFSQKDYFELYAFFDSTSDTGNSLEPVVSAPRQGELEVLERLERAVAAVESELRAPWPAEEPARAAWERNARALIADAPVFVAAPLVAGTSQGEAEIVALEDGVLELRGANPDRDAYTLDLAVPAGTVHAVRVEFLRGPDGGPGRSAHRNVVLTGIELGRVGEPGAAPVLATASRAQAGAPVEHAIDADPQSGWALAEDGEPDEAQAWFVPAAPLEPGADGLLRVVLRFDSAFAQHTPARLRVACSSDPRAAQWSELPPRVRKALTGDPTRRFLATANVASDWWRRRHTTRGRDLAARLDTLAAELAAARAPIPTTLVLRELQVPRETHVLAGGSFLARGERVERDVPAVLNPWPEGVARTRLSLADWLTDPAQPLVARVAANRLWNGVFGRGLVTTLDDFGTRGEPPSHPELLDWLACEFVAGGWSTKRFLRTLVTSSAWRQSARATPEALARDPANVLLARAHRPRLEAEVLRDNALAAAGLLERSVGGPSAFPPQPPGIWASVYSIETWSEARDASRWRRGMYTFQKRTAPYPTYLLFDATSRELSCAGRGSSNTPLQALALLNDPAFVEAAVGLAQRVLSDAGDDAARLERAWTLALARTPQARERELALELLEAQRARFAADPEAARALTDTAVPLPIAGIERGELAAWTVLANVLFNLDEFVTRG
jgi:hypothetical protein